MPDTARLIIKEPGTIEIIQKVFGSLPFILIEADMTDDESLITTVTAGGGPVTAQDVSGWLTDVAEAVKEAAERLSLVSIEDVEEDD